LSRRETGITELPRRSPHVKRRCFEQETDMRHNVPKYSLGPRQALRVTALTFALLLGAGSIVGSAPAFAEPDNGGNSAGENNFGHVGVYSDGYSAAPAYVPDAAIPAGPKVRPGYYYLSGRGWIPLNSAPGRSVRGN
jgi:hypothetical protein